MAHLTRELMWVLSREQGDGVVRGQEQRRRGESGDAEVARQPSRAISMVATSIFWIDIVASKARVAWAPPAASASVSTRGVICHESPQRSLHHPQSLSSPPLSTMAFQ